MPGKRSLVEQSAPIQRRAASGADAPGAAVPGKRTLVEQSELIQRRAAGGADASGAATSRSPNNTGLPDGLKTGLESMSGISMDSVRVHYNSAEPAKVDALAYAQGSDIHLGPGQEQHLPHEAWHVVQQAEGRVGATMQTKGGAAVNDDHGLEHEADVMGSRAAELGDREAVAAPPSPLPAAAGAPVQRRIDSKVIQRVLATVNPQNGPINLHQVGGGAAGFMVMQNPTQPAGEEVNNTVGFTGILNGAEWANLGKQPTEYWRAHAYANSFGGAGGITNVGWWKAGAETTWTEHEQNVRGAGVAAIPEWQPGAGEQGTYLVTREMHAPVALKAGYVSDLMAGVNWGFNDARAAWTRALATCDSIRPDKQREKRVAALTQARQALAAGNQARIQNWVDNLFGGANSAEGNLIKKMTMDYTIGTAGANPGPQRKSLKKSVSSEAPKPKDFGLKNEPEQIWQALANHNQGVFARANPPAALMTAAVPYDDPYKPAQVLRVYADGFGV